MRLAAALWAAPSKTRRHILVIASGFAPEELGSGPMTAALVKGLSREFRVSVATTFPHYPQYRWRAQPRRLRSEETFEGARLRRQWTVLPRRQSFAWRTTFDTAFAASMLLNAGGLDRPDLIICVCPPLQTGVDGVVLGRMWRSPFVMLYQDLPLMAALSVGMMKPGRLHRFAVRFARYIHRRAAHSVVVHQRFEAHLIAEGARVGQITHIPNPVDVEEFLAVERTAASEIEAARARVGAGRDDFLVVYAGNLGQKQGLDTLLRAAAVSPLRVRYVVIGDGSARQALIERAAALSLANFTVLPIQPREELMRILLAADACVITQIADMTDAVVPSKLLTYMAAGKPVVAAVNSRSITYDEVTKAACGICVPPEDPTAMVEALQTLSTSRVRQMTLGQSGREFVAARYSLNAVLSRWEGLIDHLLGASGRDNGRGLLAVRTESCSGRG